MKMMIRPCLVAFLSAGQRLDFHCRTAVSSRCIARFAGRWLEKPSRLSSRHTPDIRTSLRRVLRLMREHDLLAPGRVGSPRGPRSHDGTIVPDTIDTMWGTD